MDGLDPAIGYPHQIANDAIPFSNHPMKMTGSNSIMTATLLSCPHTGAGSYHPIALVWRPVLVAAVQGLSVARPPHPASQRPLNQRPPRTTSCVRIVTKLPEACRFLVRLTFFGAVVTPPGHPLDLSAQYGPLIRGLPHGIRIPNAGRCRLAYQSWRRRLDRSVHRPRSRALALAGRCGQGRR